MPFLLNIVKLPADLFSLFTMSSLVNARFGAMVAATHVAAVAVLVTTAILGRVRISLARVAQFAAVTIVYRRGIHPEHPCHLQLGIAAGAFRPLDPLSLRAQAPACRGGASGPRSCPTRIAFEGTASKRSGREACSGSATSTMRCRGRS